MEEYTLGTGFRTKCMVRDILSGQMAENIQESTNTIKSMEKECSFGQMGKSMTESEYMENKKDLEQLLILGKHKV